MELDETSKAVLGKMTGKEKQFSMSEVKYLTTGGSRYDQSSVFGALADGAKIRIPTHVLLALFQKNASNVTLTARKGHVYWIVEG